MHAIETARLTLIPATMDILEAVRFALEAHRSSLMRGPWTFYYVLLGKPGSKLPALIGLGGFKGRPSSQGEVEIGYSILPAFQRQGFATEAVTAWTDFALSHEVVSVVFAQTLSGLSESIRVAEKAGFTFAGRDPDAPADQEVLRFARRRR